MKREIKVAAVVSSRYRKYSEVCLEIFNRFFNYEDSEIKVVTDFFVHTHEKICDLNFDKTQFSQNLLSQKNIDDIKSILSPKVIVVETDYKNISSKVDHYNANNLISWCTDERYNNDFHRLYQYHSFEEGVKLVNKYEEENNFTYDLVFKLRPDLYLNIDQNAGYVFKHPFTWEDRHAELISDNASALWARHFRLDNTIFAQSIVVICGYPSICDTSFFGSSASIKKLTDNFTVQIVENMISVYTEYKNNILLMHSLLVPESLIVHHVKKKLLLLMPTPTTYLSVCIRSNYIPGSDFSKTYELYSQFWQGERIKLKTKS